MPKSIKIALIALGCAKNTVDGELALAALTAAGFVLTVAPADADLILINTCGFIEDARVEAEAEIAAAAALKKNNPRVKIIVMGCYAQLFGREMLAAFPEVDAVCGLGILPKIVAVCRDVWHGKKINTGFTRPAIVNAAPRLLSTPPSYAYLRIGDGCDNRCTYCAIPHIRGGLRSRTLKSLIAEAQTLAAQGIQELLIISQDITAYGHDFPRRPHSPATKLITLLEKILATTALPRVRLLYAHPRHLSAELLQLLGSEPRLCNYLDLPLQHVNSRILKQMHRHYSRRKIDKIINQIAKFCPTLTWRSTFITGFPSETAAEFAEVLAFVHANHLAHLGVFTYSPEINTAAYNYRPLIAPEVAAARRDKLMQAQQKNAFARADKRLGATVAVLIDRVEKAAAGIFAIGRSVAEAPEIDGEIFVRGAKNPSTTIGKILSVTLTQRSGYDFYGKL